MFFEQVIEYFKTNLIESIIIGGIALLLIIAIISLICAGAKAKKRKKQAKSAATATVQTPAPEAKAEEPTPVVAPVEKVAEPVPEKVAPVEKVAEPAPKKVAPVQKAEEPAPKKVAPASSVKKEQAPKAVHSALAATKKMGESKAPEAKTEEAPASKPVQKTAPKAAAKPVTKPAPAQPAETEKGNRYTGKWVICKLILTDDKDQPLEEHYFFELRASNGELLLASEEYLSHAGALKGIQTHKDNVEKDNFRITVSKKGDYIFKLLTGKNTLLCTGANYKSLERCESAVASTKRFAATAVLQEDVEEVRIKLPAEDDTPIELPAEGYEGKWIISTKGDETVGVMYYFELFASNGEKLLTSEEYTTYEGAVNAVYTHKANIAKGNFRISITKRGDYIFKLLGGNGQLLCLGEHYKTRSRCENAIESVKRFSESAPVLRYGEIKQA
ncbi:MAG: DUF1508 domain-containing protein [Clostridia bacterium]|nr:DUF1508 domain-containing protein [Clostridia bacterium]